MNRFLTYCMNCIYVLYYRLRYGRSLTISSKQLLNKSFHLIIQNKGKASIGSMTSNRGNLYINVDGGELSVGHGCFFNTGVSITCLDRIDIGENCAIANNVVIVDHDHDFRKGSGYKCSPIKIGNNVWIGANCVILRGSIIEDNCVIAAGTVVRNGYYASNSMVKNDIMPSVSEITY